MHLKYFGTDGIRGVVGDVLTTKLAFRIGRYLGYDSGGRRRRILIGRDTRASGDLLMTALANGMILSGADVFDAGVTSTPSISYLVVEKVFDFGIMISASHNPFYDNGIKIFNHEGEKISDAIEKDIELYIDAEEDYLPKATYEDIGRLIYAPHLVDSYVNFLYKKGKGIKSNFRIAVDCANGSASSIAPKIFNQLDVRASFIHNVPNGININDNCGSTHPECLIEKIKTKKYDVGFAFDGDSDRVLLVSPEGELIDGDAIIYLNALNMARRGKLKNNAVALTVMSNLGVKQALKKQGISVVETAVGDKYVQQTLKEKNLSLGGEQSGHIIFADDLLTGDGILTAIKVLKTMHFENKSLAELLKDFQKYPQVLINVPVTDKKQVMEDEALAKLIKEVDDALGEEGRLLVRASGTENLIRVMAEAIDKGKCEAAVNKVVTFIKNTFE